MKPNFALILSMDGIALLQRASPGWAIVGEAYPGGDTLADDMARLRADAELLEPGTATFKVVIPNDQIRYLAIPAGAPDPMGRQRAVEEALDGATPYALDELTIDHTISGDTLYIAAVALETLQEADEFARSFGFDPMSFVAMPENRDYLGEPFFGTAHDVPDDIHVTPDSTAIRVTGRVKLPAPEDTPAPVDPAEDSAPDSAPVSFSSVRSRAGDTAAKAEGPDGAADDSTGDAASDTEGKSVSAIEPRSDAPRITFAAPQADDTPAAVVVPPRDVLPEEMSASLKTDSDDDTPKPSPLATVLGAAAGLRGRIGSALADRRAQRAARQAEAARLAKEAVKAGRKAPTVAAGIENPAPSPVAAEGAPKLGAAKGGDAAGSAPKLTAVPTTPGAAPVDPGTAKPKSKGKGRKGKAAAAAAPATTPEVAEAAPDLTPMEKVVTSLHAHKDEGRAPGVLTADERRAEEERLTVFGQRGASYDAGGGGSAGLVTAVILVVFLAGAGVWAMLFNDASLSGLIGADTSEAPTEEVATAPQESFVPPAPSDPVDSSDADTADDTAAIAAPEEITLDDAPTAEDAAVAQALAGEVDETPVPDAGAEPAPEQVTEAPADTPSETPAEEDAPVSPLIVTEAAIAEVDDQAAEEPTDDTMTPEEEAAYAASGIWQDSPDGIAAGSDATGTGTGTGADPDAPPERNPSVDLAALTPDRLPAPPAPPPIFGQRFNMDDRGLVIATPEGALTPSGVRAFAGDPPVVPPTRPGDPDPAPAPAEAPAEPEPDAPAPEAEAQPEAAAEPQSDAQLDIAPETAPVEAPADAPAADEVDQRFAGVRPRQRPTAPEPEVAEAETETEVETTDDAAAVAGASLAGVAGRTEGTALIADEDRASIAAGLATDTEAAEDEETASAAGLVPDFPALRPLQRPGNITELAAAARATPVPAPAIQPTGPTAVSVARQATVRNALNLREVNLIGVYGQPADRRALVRLSNGRYRKVKVGDRIDGGRVLAIGDDTLRYQKDGRNLTLNMPSG